jgi:hypothetical protein
MANRNSNLDISGNNAEAAATLLGLGRGPNNVSRGAAGLMALRGENNNRHSRNSNRNNRSGNNNNVGRGAAGLMALRANNNVGRGAAKLMALRANNNVGRGAAKLMALRGNNNNVQQAAQGLLALRGRKEKQDGGEFPAPVAMPSLKRQNGYLPESKVPAGILEDADAGPGAASLSVTLPINSRRKIAFEPTQTRKRGGRKTRRSRR